MALSPAAAGIPLVVECTPEKSSTLVFEDFKARKYKIEMGHSIEDLEPRYGP